MTDHICTLPQCLERFQAIQRDVREIKNDVKHLRKTLTDDPSNSIAAVVNRHRGYWKLFAILAALIAAGCTIAGTIYAAIG